MIELLVVVAIIAILSGLVIVNLTTAREKSQDGAIKQQIAQMRSAALLYQDNNNGSFSTANVAQSTVAASSTCALAGSVFADTSVSKAVSAVASNAGSSPNCAFGTPGGAGSLPADSWVFISSLRSTSTQYWCADSSGIAKAVTSKTVVTTTGGEVTCP